MKRIIFISIIIFFVGCTKEPASDSSHSVCVDVKTTMVRSGQIEETVSATGTITTFREAQLRSSITGIIVDFKFFNGDRIKKGETIAEVRTKESQASIQGAEELVRFAKTPEQIQEAQHALELAKQTANTITIRAPFDGILINKLKNELEVISEGDQIATLVDPQSMIFLADVPSSSSNKIKIGQRASIRFMKISGSSFNAVVKRIESQVNPGDQTARVQLALIDQVPNLERSLFGDASIIVGKRQRALLVPTSALLHDDESNITSVMIVLSDSIAHKIPVNVVVKSDSVSEISSAQIAEGNIIITQGHFGLPDSTCVRVQN